MFEVGKTYPTSDGRDATLVHIFENPVAPGCALLWVVGNTMFRTAADGMNLTSKEKQPNDVMPPIRVGYVNVYDGHYGIVRPSRADADGAASKYQGRTACVRLEYHEGQFDE